MPVTINVKIEDQEVKDMLGRLQDRTANLTPAMKIIGQIVRTSVVRNFERGGRPDKWKPLSKVTLGLAFTMAGKTTHTKKGNVTAAFSRYMAGKRILIGQGFAGGLMGSIKLRYWRRPA